MSALHSRAIGATVLAAALLTAGCGEVALLPVASGTGPNPQLPAPRKTLLPTVNIAKAVGWTNGSTPMPAAGTRVNLYASGLDHPRWVYVLPNGDVLVAETNSPPKPEDGKGLRGWVMGMVMGRAGAKTPSANRITLLRDADGDGIAETRSVFLDQLASPFGMALVGTDLYVANSNGIVRFAYTPGATTLVGQASRPVTDLPAGPINHHWTKNIIASPDGRKLYATVGSNSNIGENGLAAEDGRAAIWEVDLASGAKRLFASGIRNPNGMAWGPGGATLWTVVNERDEIGSDLVPDYLTSVKEGGFYGWPYSYYGQHVDERVQPAAPEKVARAITPEYALGPHTASLGLAGSQGNRLPATFADGMFIGQHGSWNRSPHSGYKVVFVPFAGGKPTGAQPVDVLTGFLDAADQAQGRPVGVAVDSRGALLVADDVGNSIWRVSAAGG